jgi:hypothetical protein
MLSKRRSLASSSCSYSSSGSNEDSVENDLSSTTSPTPETVRATLDMYVSAARVGRDAFAKGDLQTAVRQFDQALALELQTELDCIYDPSIGMVSGLVRQEVSDRMMQTSPRHSPGSASCNKIMRSLMQIYKDSEATVRLRPAEPKLYLRMGAALCCANEWEKAKKIYTDGLNVCKDRKELKLALRRLTKMEQITSAKEIPREPYDASTLTDKKNKSRTLPSLSAALRSKRKSDTIEAMDLSSSLDSTIDNRSRARISKSPGAESPRHHARPIRARRVSSFGKISRQKKVPEIDHRERESWSMVFQTDFCKDQVQLRPSAISQMRRLSLELLDQDMESGDRSSRSQRDLNMKGTTSFAVKNFQSMKIESDDSELEDDY